MKETTLLWKQITNGPITNYYDFQLVGGRRVALLQA